MSFYFLILYLLDVYRIILFYIFNFLLILKIYFRSIVLLGREISFIYINLIYLLYKKCKIK